MKVGKMDVGLMEMVQKSTILTKPENFENVFKKKLKAKKKGKKHKNKGKKMKMIEKGKKVTFNQLHTLRNYPIIVISANSSSKIFANFEFKNSGLIFIEEERRH